MKKLLWFIHVPRTGGMSLARALNKVRSDELAIRHSGHEKFSYQTLKVLKEKYDKVYTCTIIRNPVSHSMSLWTYIRKHKEHLKHSESFEPFIQWCKNFKEFPYYPKFFGNGDIDGAIKVLKNFDYILDTDTLTADSNKMMKEIGAFNFRIAKSNSTSKRSPNKNELKVIQSVRKDDFKVYNEIK